MTEATELATARNGINALNQRWYAGGSPDRAFAHWVLKCLLADLEPDDSLLKDFTAMSGPGDCGIDAYWIDFENSRLILVQAKDTPRIQRKHVQEFRAAIEALLDQEFVKKHGNAVLKEVYPGILDCILDESYSIHAVVAGRRIMPGAKDYAGGEGSASWHYSEGDSIHAKEFQIEALDILELAEAGRQLSLREDPKVRLPVESDDVGSSYHFMTGVFRSVLATVPASVLADAYDRYRSAIFQFNPRGPQGSNKVNKDILETLADPIMRTHFHLLNNGITVVCDGVTLSARKDYLNVDNFQVVNGCQTVYTLYSSRQFLTPNVKVNVRVVEGLHGLSSTIARASNSQTSVKAEQLASLGPEHERVARELDLQSQPWYYESQLGQVRFLTAIKRREHVQKYDARSTSITELGQFGTAFLGYPIMAKYDLKAVFEKRKEGAEVYEAIFLNKDNTAQQLLLPVLVGRRVYGAVRAKLASLEETVYQDDFTELDWAPFARMHLVALVGSQEFRGSPAPQRLALLPADKSKVLIDTIDEWFPSAFDAAYSAVRFYVEVDQTAGTLVNLREFFRSQDRYMKMVREANRRHAAI